MKPVVRSFPLTGTPYRTHTVELDGVELRSQLHAFTPEEIEEAVRLYREYGIRTPRPETTSWPGALPPMRAPGGPDSPIAELDYTGGYSE